MATPTTIARYEILNRIGRGGMGSLYLAKDPKIDRLVAIKVLNADLDRDDLRIRFDREARSAGALNHPNIVTIFDYGVFEDSPYIVMEYLRGETLAELVRRRAPMTLAQKLGLLEQLCRGLGYAHEAGIIHRDIKPANLMIDQHNVLKILDFGIARLAESGLTQMSALIGTPGYMSPEQIEGRTVERASDMFAVGAVAYELLTYRPAFGGDSQSAIIFGVLHSAPESILALAPEVGPDVAAIVERALEKTTAARYADAPSMQADLQAARETLTGSRRTATRLTPVGVRRPALTNPSETPTTLASVTAPMAHPPTGDNLLDAAQLAFGARDLPRALSLLERLLATEPEHAEALALKQEVEDARVEELLSKARVGLVGQRFTEASDCLSRALRIRPRSEAALQLRTEVEERRLEAERRLGGRARAKAAVERGRRYLQEGAWDAARRAADEAWALDPKNQDAVALLQAATDGEAAAGTASGVVAESQFVSGSTEAVPATIPMGSARLPASGPVSAADLAAGQRGSRRALWIGLAAVGTIVVVVTAMAMLNRPKTPDAPPPDVTPPEVAIVSPPENAPPLSGLVSIVVNATDDVAVAGVKVTVDGTQIGDELTSPPFEIPWKSVDFADARHLIVVEARDKAGNRNQARLYVSTRNEPPSTRAGGPSGSQGQNAPGGRGRATDPVVDQAKLDALLERIRGLVQDGNWTEVLKEANQGLRDFPGDSKLKTYKTVAEGKIKGNGGEWLD